MARREYLVTQHARDRLAERYHVALAPDTWRALLEDLESWPYQVTDQRRAGTEIREAQVRLDGPDGSALILPVVYLCARWRVSVLTVKPGGLHLRRPSHAPKTA